MEGPGQRSVHQDIMSLATAIKTRVAGLIPANVGKSTAASAPAASARAVYSVLKASFLTNHAPTAPIPFKRQVLHIDVAASAKNEAPPVIIVALQRCGIYAIPYSQHMVKAWAKEQEACNNNPLNKTLITACTTDLKAADKTVANGLPEKVVAQRYVMEPGDILIMNGHTIHAGDEGVLGHPALRLHLYCNTVVGKLPKNETFPLAKLAAWGESDEFRAHFVFPSEE